MALDQEHALNLQHVYGGADIEKLKNGEVDILTMMSYNELFTLIDAGISKEEMSLFPIADFGYHIPEDGLYSSREFFLKETEVCKNFTDASLKGWQMIAENPELALDLVMAHHKRSSMPTSRQHQENMLHEVIKLVKVGKSNMGQLNQDDFNKTVKILNQIQLIRQKIDISDFFAKF